MYRTLLGISSHNRNMPKSQFDMGNAGKISFDEGPALHRNTKLKLESTIHELRGDSHISLASNEWGTFYTVCSNADLSRGLVLHGMPSHNHLGNSFDKRVKEER